MTSQRDALWGPSQPELEYEACLTRADERARARARAARRDARLYPWLTAMGIAVLVVLALLFGGY